MGMDRETREIIKKGITYFAVMAIGYVLTIKALCLICGI